MDGPFSNLPHLDEHGSARMVDVGHKPNTHRIAVAEAYISMLPETVDLLEAGSLAKGDALAVARLAGIMASKRTAELIPLAHPIALTHVAVDIALEDDGVRIETRVETVAPTGVEMEALTAATTAALAIYDMAKKHDRAMAIERVRLLMKSGGESGTYSRTDEETPSSAPPEPPPRASTEKRGVPMPKTQKNKALSKSSKKKTKRKSVSSKKKS